MSDLYDADILAWSERQSALLRRLAGLAFGAGRAALARGGTAVPD
jgi:hypothetical protein